MNESQLIDMLIEVRDTNLKINNKADAIATAHEATHGEVVRLRRIITGESEPEHGIVLRLRNVEERLDRICADRAAIRNWAFSAVGAAVISILGALWSKIIP